MTRVAGSNVCEVHTKWFNNGDISKQTVSGWVQSVIKQAYLVVKGENIPHLTYTNFQVSFYLRNIAQMGVLTSACPFVAGQKVLTISHMYPPPVLRLLLQPEQQKG